MWFAKSVCKDRGAQADVLTPRADIRNDAGDRKQNREGTGTATAAA